MKIVIFGLTISSSWGNGHATLWRGLCNALAERGHAIVFFERDAPYYAANRDLAGLPDGDLVLFAEWEDVRRRARADLADADVAIVTSYCPDALAATALVLDAGRPLKVFYDLDTPVTLSRVERGEPTGYIGPRGLADFDLVLSYTGGGALDALRHLLGSRTAVPLYGHVDPAVHRPVPAAEHFRADLSYLGTYAADRQAALERLFVAPARERPGRRFLIGGAQYPQDFPWTDNIYFVRHLPPADHTVWFPDDALAQLPDDVLSFLLFPVERPEFFDAVVLDDDDAVVEIQVKRPDARSRWIWGAFKMPGRVLAELHALWLARERRDEYIGTLVNAYLAGGGRAVGVKAGTSYVDVGTLGGYRSAITLLSSRGALPEHDLPEPSMSVR